LIILSRFVCLDSWCVGGKLDSMTLLVYLIVQGMPYSLG
jgi:hypothetical protein